MSAANTKATDLEQLQREYRHMEQNRKAYAEESHAVLRKQQQSIDKLRRDNDGLKTEIAMQMRTSIKPANNFQQSMIEKLGDQMDKYSKQIEVRPRMGYKPRTGYKLEGWREKAAGAHILPPNDALPTRRAQ